MTRSGRVLAAAGSFLVVTAQLLAVGASAAPAASLAPISLSIASDPNPVLRGDSTTVTVGFSPTTDAADVFLHEVGSGVGTTVSVDHAKKVDIPWWSRTAGTFHLEACLFASATFEPTCSPVLDQVVVGLATTTSLAISPNPDYPDGPLSVDVAVSPAPETPIDAFLEDITPPTGGGRWNVPIGVDGLGHLDLTGSQVQAALSVGHHTLAVYFPGTLHDDPSWSNSIDMEIRQDPSTTALSLSSSAIASGDSVTMSVAVTPAPAAGTPVGVAISAPLGIADNVTVTLDASGHGSANWDSTGASTAQYTFTATYGGTTRIGPSSDSQSVAITVPGDQPPGTEITILYGPAYPIVANTSASFTAHITPYAAGRTVSWSIDGAIASQSITNPNGVATTQLTFGPGTYGVTAILEPVNNLDRAESAEYVVTVTPDPARLPDRWTWQRLGYPSVDSNGTNARIGQFRTWASATSMFILATDTVTGRHLSLQLQATGGSILEPGSGVSDSSNIWLQDQPGCGSGSVTRYQFLSLERDAAGVPISFAMSYEFLCNADQYWPIVGIIRYNSSTPVPELSLPDGSPAFDSVIEGHVGTARTFTMANHGDGTIAIGQLGVEGTNAGEFIRSADGCSGQSLTTGASCSFEVTFAPTSSGPKSAHLVIPSDAGLSPRNLAIRGEGLVAESVSLPTVAGDVQWFTPGIRYEATVTPNPAVNGSECLVDGAHVDGSGVDADGRVFCVSARPGPGTHTVAVHYLGSVFHGEAVSPIRTFVVDPTTITTVTSSATTASANVPIEIDATVAFAGDVTYGGGTLTITDATSGSVIGAGSVSPASPTISVTRVFSAGAHHLVATYAGTSGESASSGVQDIQITAPTDVIAPTATAPAARFATAATLSGALLPVVVSWTSADSGSGVDHVMFRQRTDGGAWSAPGSIIGTSTSRLLWPGHVYQFQVQPVDRAGNVGIPVSGASFRLTGVQQSSSAVHYLGTWSSSTSTTWWGGTARNSTKAGSTVSYTFTGKSIAWVGLKAATRGKAYVYVNGVYKATVDLYSATTLKQRIVWSANYSTSATRKVTIKVLGTGGRPRVDIDGFIVGS